MSTARRKVIQYTLNIMVIQNFMLRLLVWLKRSFGACCNRLLYNRRVAGVKYVHLMFNDKFNKPFVDFLNRYFDPKEHLVLCKRRCAHPFPEGDNVIEVKSYRGFEYDRKNIEYVIFHSLCDDEMVDILYRNEKLQNKSAWLIWGVDLYSAEQNEKNDYVRRHLRAFLTVADGDGDYARQLYKVATPSFPICYNLPISCEMIMRVKAELHKEPKRIHVQINNSCDGSTLEMLYILSSFNRLDVEVSTILSYGDCRYKEEITRVGNELFGDRFSYTDSFEDPEEYVRRMAKVNVLIMNQDRQQGLGNITLGLALGTKVFIKSTVSSYAYFTSKGIVIFDTNTIANLPFKEFVAYSREDRNRNMELACQFYDEERMKTLWEEFLKNS